MRSKPKYTKNRSTCIRCGKVLGKWKQKYCSKECRELWYKYDEPENEIRYVAKKEVTMLKRKIAYIDKELKYIGGFRAEGLSLQRKILQNRLKYLTSYLEASKFLQRDFGGDE